MRQREDDAVHQQADRPQAAGDERERRQPAGPARRRRRRAVAEPALARRHGLVSGCAAPARRGRRRAGRRVDGADGRVSIGVVGRHALHATGGVGDASRARPHPDRSPFALRWGWWQPRWLLDRPGAPVAAGLDRGRGALALAHRRGRRWRPKLAAGLDAGSGDDLGRRHRPTCTAASSPMTGAADLSCLAATSPTCAPPAPPTAAR